MKNYLMKHSLQLVKKYNQDISDTQIAELEYGLLGIYLTVSKIIVIFLLAWLLNIIPEVAIFMVIFNIIRTCSFGLHATKSWICLLSSTIIFILFPLMCKHIILPDTKWIISIITISFIYKNSPADTHKRPIVNPKRRKVYKILSTIIAIVFALCAIIIKNNFYSNCFIYAPIVQCFLISPMVYKFFHLPYDNYKTYLANVNII